MYEMITLRMALKLAIRAHACKGNCEAFKKALDEGNELECYQIALGNRGWLIKRRIINTSDLTGLEKLAQGVGKTYYNNGQLCDLTHYKNYERHGLREIWHGNGKRYIRANYKNGKLHGLYEEWGKNGKSYYRAHFYNNEEVT